MSNKELYEHKRSDTVKWVITLLGFILVGVMLAGIICGWFGKNEKPDIEDETEQAAIMDGNGNEMTGDSVYPMPEKMSFSAVAFAVPLAGERVAGTVTPQSVEVRIEAYVYPENAANREVDYSVAWGNAPTHGGEPVSNYLTVTPDSDGSRLATVSCKKGFDDDTIIITVTTRDVGHTATCTVNFVGIATEINVSSSTAAKKTNSGRGTYYEMGTNKTYTFNLSLSNSLNDAAGNLSVSEIGGEGTLYFCNGYYNDGGYLVCSETFQKDLSEIAGKFITSATISGNTLTVKTGSKILEEYYAYSAPDDLYIVEMLYDRYVVEVEDDLSGYKEKGDTFYNQNAKYNAENLDSCYFYVTVKDSVSGIEETIKLWLTSSVSNVSLVSSLTF